MAKFYLRDCSRQYLPVRYPISPFHWDELTDDDQKAFVREHGIQVCTSTFIDEVTTTYGFGRLNKHGWWEYTCMWKAREEKTT